jgi:hypothetical protein
MSYEKVYDKDPQGNSVLTKAAFDQTVFKLKFTKVQTPKLFLKADQLKGLKAWDALDLGPTYLDGVNPLLCEEFHRFLKRAWAESLDIRKTLSDNAMKDMMAEEDGKFLKILEASCRIK